MHVYIYLIHCAGKRKLTQHHKAITLQEKLKGELIRLMGKYIIFYVLDFINTMSLVGELKYDD